MLKKRKIPMRMCIVCREMKPKQELIRIVKNKQNEISLDLGERKPGRGAYLCSNAICLEKARKGKKVEKVFGVNACQEVYEDFMSELEEGYD